MTERQFSGFDYIFSFRPKYTNKGLWAKLNIENGDDPLPFVRGEMPYIPHFSASWAMKGRYPLDVVGTTSALPTLISERVRSLLVNEGFTGWVSWPCPLRDRDGSVHPHHFLGITGRCGAIDYSRSEVFTTQMPAGPSVHLRGSYFDPATWDGSDLFLSGQTVLRFMTDRLRNCLVSNNITGLELVAADKQEVWTVAVGYMPPTQQ